MLKMPFLILVTNPVNTSVFSGPSARSRQLSTSTRDTGSVRHEREMWVRNHVTECEGAP